MSHEAAVWVAMMAARQWWWRHKQRGEGSKGRRHRAVAMAGMWEEVAAVARIHAAAAAAAVGPLPKPSFSCHSRGSSLLSFFK